MIDILAYVHLAAAYEWQTNTPLFRESQSRAFFETIQWRSLSSRTRSRWLSVGMTLVALSLVSEAIVASVGGDRVLAQTYPRVCASDLGGRTLRIGSWDPEVRNLQQMLHNLGYYYVRDTGIFDRETEAAVLQFQRTQKLSVDGEVGRQTRAALREACLSHWGVSRPISPENLPGDTQYRYPSNPPRVGFDVRILQTRLREAGFYGGSITGVFDERTRDAVRKFQAEEDLPIDGVVDRFLLSRLENYIYDNQNSERYVVVVPMRRNVRRNSYLISDVNRALIHEVNDDLHYVNQALWRCGYRHQAQIVDDDRRGNYINAGLYSDRSEAEDLSDNLRDLGIDARVMYDRDPT